MRWVWLILYLTACDQHPRVQTAFLTHQWQLDTINGVPFDALVTMDIHRSGLVYGTMPCNTFSSTLTRFPAGWEFGSLRLHNRPCPRGNAEAAFVQAITQVTRSRVEGVRLILSGPATQLQFRRSSGQSFPPM